MAGVSAERRTYHLKVWRQASAGQPGTFQEITAKDISPNQSFLEMLDTVNQELIGSGQEPIHFEHDCREGICGTCSMVINGNPHGPQLGTATCQLHMRVFENGAKIVIEPFRANAFPIIKDLAVDRTALDQIIEAGGYISVKTGSAPEANSVPVRKEAADLSFMSATCISCGACVAACPNGSAMLFTGAKVRHLGLLPQGQPEHQDRVLNRVRTMDELGFGNCSNTGACTLSCPKEISQENIASLNREYLKATMRRRD